MLVSLLPTCIKPTNTPKMLPGSKIHSDLAGIRARAGAWLFPSPKVSGSLFFILQTN